MNDIQPAPGEPAMLALPYWELLGLAIPAPQRWRLENNITAFPPSERWSEEWRIAHRPKRKHGKPFALQWRLRVDGYTNHWELVAKYPTRAEAELVITKLQLLVGQP